MILAIDPGKRAYGVAWFDEGRLVQAKFVQADVLWNEVDLLPDGRRSVINRLILERQYLTKDHPRPMDIVELAFAAGYAKGLVAPAPVTEYLPIKWKGNVPKKIMTNRILSKLTPEEKAVIEKVGYLDHNTVDGIGLGLYYLGRL